MAIRRPQKSIFRTFSPYSAPKPINPIRPIRPTQKAIVSPFIRARTPVAPKRSVGIAKARVPAYTSSMARTGTISSKKPSGVIAGVKTLAGVASYIPGLGGAVAGLVAKVLPSGQTVMVRKRRKRGLTHSDIKGATRVLRLVKKFAPPGSKMKLRHRHNVSSY